LSFIPGERTNLKLTTKEDLLLAEAILRISG
ncbi:MAG: 2-C-methyl-D-erythritol 4-phosphate cytidylyltransferase, partial [Bacteroidales bacterium]|nr:2-C-methyl-D-erythritol 4-phosphate cytidylyltransferase [Bacteroidales bacterium]